MIHDGREWPEYNGLYWVRRGETEGWLVMRWDSYYHWETIITQFSPGPVWQWADMLRPDEIQELIDTRHVISEDEPSPHRTDGNWEYIPADEGSAAHFRSRGLGIEVYPPDVELKPAVDLGNDWLGELRRQLDNIRARVEKLETLTEGAPRVPDMWMDGEP